MNANQISVIFSNLVKKTLTFHELRLVIKLNKREINTGICHTHDHCDANELMMNAFDMAGIVKADEQISDEKFIPLWNEAWDIAKKNEFYFDSKLNEKHAVEILYQNSESKLSNVYDSNADVAEAINFLIKDFEYPNYSYKTIKQILLTYFIKNLKELDMGRIVATATLSGYITDHEIDLSPYLYNHSHMNWGKLTDDDQLANFVAIATKDGRLLSKYTIQGGKPIYIITDFETDTTERYTTAMFTSDY